MGLGRGFRAGAIGARFGLTALALDLADALLGIFVVGLVTGLAELAALPFGVDDCGGWELVPCGAG